MDAKKRAAENFRNLRGAFDEERRSKLEKKSDIENKITGFFMLGT